MQWTEGFSRIPKMPLTHFFRKSAGPGFDVMVLICSLSVFQVKGQSMSGNDRIRASLYALGLPIAQGALSTILGVFGLAFAPSYIFITFFKMIFLVIALGALHGVVLLPVLLSLFGPGSCSTNNKQPKMVSVFTSRETAWSRDSSQKRG